MIAANMAELLTDLQESGQRVKVARNLHEQKLSVRGKNDHLVRDENGEGLYVTSIKLADVKFIVLPSGRERCLREKKKNLHAFAQGRIASGEDAEVGCNATQVTYNPYKMGSFYCKETEQPINRADQVFIFASGKMIAINARWED